MAHAQYDIWEEDNPGSIRGFPWRAQLVGYIGNFQTRASAERFVSDVKVYREKEGLK